MKSQNTILKESNDSNQFLIGQLNLALTKANGRIKVLEEKMGEHDAILAKQSEQIAINTNSIIGKQPNEKQPTDITSPSA